jgi:hypothetical protein
LIPAILMVLQHQHGPKQWCKCTAAHRIGLHRRGQLLDRQVNREIETLIPAILMVLQHQHGPKQWCKCTAAHLAFDSLNSALETERSEKCSSSMSQERTAVRKSECKQCN